MGCQAAAERSGSWSARRLAERPEAYEPVAQQGNRDPAEDMQRRLEDAQQATTISIERGRARATRFSGPNFPDKAGERVGWRGAFSSP